jgi:hypothetical protein
MGRFNAAIVRPDRGGVFTARRAGPGRTMAGHESGGVRECASGRYCGGGDGYGCKDGAQWRTRSCEREGREGGREEGREGGREGEGKREGGGIGGRKSERKAGRGMSRDLGGKGGKVGGEGRK